jgi:hypothetical protein
MYGALNVYEKIITQYDCKLRDKSFKPNYAMIGQCGATVTFANNRLIRLNKFVSQFPGVIYNLFCIRLCTFNTSNVCPLSDVATKPKNFPHLNKAVGWAISPKAFKEELLFPGHGGLSFFF